MSGHVDLVAHDPLTAGRGKLLRRTHRHDPLLASPIRDGSAIYAYLSEPHELWDCPFGPGDEIERAVSAVYGRPFPFLRACVALMRAGVSVYSLRECAPFISAELRAWRSPGHR